MTQKTKTATDRITESVVWMVLMMVLLVPFGALPVMLAAGILHQYWPAIPPFGFWETWIVLVAINVIGNGVKTGTKLNSNQT